VDPELVRRYESVAGAAAYREKYRRSWVRRISHRREMGVVRNALERAGATGEVLDCPCGAGRLVPEILRRARHVTAVDASAAMVDEARAALLEATELGRVTFAVASVDALPFPTDAFDTVVCHRLLHHVLDPEERGRILGELARVARRRVVLSFADATTRKARSQERRGRARRRAVLTPVQLEAEASVRGLLLEPPVLRLASWASVLAVAVLRVEA
jgi:ubiquinone/menaquinone biosynthesis C-methylase UbiE